MSTPEEDAKAQAAANQIGEQFLALAVDYFGHDVRADPIYKRMLFKIKEPHMRKVFKHLMCMQVMMGAMTAFADTVAEAFGGIGEQLLDGKPVKPREVYLPKDRKERLRLFLAKGMLNAIKVDGQSVGLGGVLVCGDES